MAIPALSWDCPWFKLLVGRQPRALLGDLGLRPALASADSAPASPPGQPGQDLQVRLGQARPGQVRSGQAYYSAKI